MADTYSQIYIQIVFAVKGRQQLIKPDWEEELYKYITGIVKAKNHALLAIHGMPDHIHILIAMRPTCCLTDLVREIKKSSNAFITDNKFVEGKFHWQEGYGAFSYSRWGKEKIINYILGQKEHHKMTSFKQEYLALLKDNEIDYKEEHLFEFY